MSDGHALRSVDPATALQYPETLLHDKFLHAKAAESDNNKQHSSLKMSMATKTTETGSKETDSRKQSTLHPMERVSSESQGKKPTKRSKLSSRLGKILTGNFRGYSTSEDASTSANEHRGVKYFFKVHLASSVGINTSKRAESIELLVKQLFKSSESEDDSDKEVEPIGPIDALEAVKAHTIQSIEKVSSLPSGDLEEITHSNHPLSQQPILVSSENAAQSTNLTTTLNSSSQLITAEINLSNTPSPQAGDSQLPMTAESNDTNREVESPHHHTSGTYSSSSEPDQKEIGYSYWLKRREEWSKPNPKVKPRQSTLSHIPVESYPKVYKSMIGSHPLKQPMRLDDALKVMYEGWVADGTWFVDDKRHAGNNNAPGSIIVAPRR